MAQRECPFGVKSGHSLGASYLGRLGLVWALSVLVPTALPAASTAFWVNLCNSGITWLVASSAFVAATTARIAALISLVMVMVLSVGLLATTMVPGR